MQVADFWGKQTHKNQICATLSPNFIKILDICKSFAPECVNSKGNVARRGAVPKFSDLEVFALSLTAEASGIDSDNFLFKRLNSECAGEIAGLTAANVHDINYLNDLKWEYHDCLIIGDKGYLSASGWQNLFDCANITLDVPYRLNQKDWVPPSDEYRRFRKRIETGFSQLDDTFIMVRNYAKQTAGFFTRIAAFTMMQYFNFLNGKPIGRVKYASF